MTVGEVMFKIETLNHFIEELDRVDIATFKDGDLLKLSDILVDYRDMLSELKVKTN